MHLNRRNHLQSGFTLMELLIVIAVLDLLLGMLIPRLGGVTDDTVDTVCDTNNKGVRYFTQMYYNKHGSLPAGLTNFVDNTGGTAALPSREDPAVAGAEAMSDAFWTRNWPGLYTINAAEAAELRAMGIDTVYDLVGHDGTDNVPMRRKAVPSTGLIQVMMVGVTDGGGATAGTVAWTTDGTSSVVAGADIGNPQWLGRIIMGVNNQSDIVTEGMIAASALCPGAVLAQDNFTEGNFMVVLPRLEATMDRMIADITAVVDANDDKVHDNEVVYVVPGGTQLFTFEMGPMAAWNFDVSCPEGHKWPAADEDLWEYSAGL